jgi:Uma2 family endonuclease
VIDSPHRKINVDEFHRLFGRFRGYELLDGIVIQKGSDMPAPLPKHYRGQKAHLGLIKALFRADADTTGEVFTQLTRLWLDYEVQTQPEFFWVSRSTPEIYYDEARVIGVPDLVVEFLRPETAKIVRSERFASYERFGVREYWIVDLANEAVDLYVLRDARYARLGVYGEGDSFESPALGQTVALNGVFPK